MIHTTSHFNIMCISQKLVKTKQACEEQQQLVSAHCSTEKALSAQARQLLATADVATKHVACLHDTVDKRKLVVCLL